MTTLVQTSSSVAVKSNLSDLSFRAIFYPGGFAPPDPPTRALARRFAGSLRSRGSLAALVSLPGGFAPPASAKAPARLAEAPAARRRPDPHTLCAPKDRPRLDRQTASAR